MVLQEGRNWHASYAARTYRHCMECARAYSRRRYGLIRPGVKRRKPLGLGLAGSGQVVKRDRSVKARAEAAKARRERTTE
ncbi:hypothetical protein GGQ87_002226 [Brevundimonas alba]|uniref:Uncharacterized protein n=1 Tax=Brevundimonas alba TaxID=74314 RepID=A0A7X6BPW4_9CAUL|nr:hypothetical protein [Brevundimonas alba]